MLTLGTSHPGPSLATTRQQKLFKPSKDGESLVVSNEKKLLQFWMSGFCWFLHDGRMFKQIFVYSNDGVIPWEPTKRADFVAQSFIGF